MFERFSSHARHTVVLAQEEARGLHHNYIGTEHILLGLLSESEGLAFRALQGFGMTLEGARQEVRDMIGVGKGGSTGARVPFTPRAKKILELALREALQLHHNYIGTEHILLGVIREGDGVGAQILKRHGDPTAIRMAVLDLLPEVSPETKRGRRWVWARRRHSEAAESGAPGEEPVLILSATPAADTTLSEAARLAGAHPVGSHHLLLAALADPDTAAARALTALGIDLDRAKEALRTADVVGTSDEQPEEAGRRQMVIQVADERITIEAADPVIVEAARATLQALGDKADPPGTIRGDLAECASLSTVWQALQNSLRVIQRRATLPAESSGDGQDKPDAPGTEAAWRVT
jgi:ATP-dependent Clp protease ATP-binding subunit ClpA